MGGMPGVPTSHEHICKRESWRIILMTPGNFFTPEFVYLPSDASAIVFGLIKLIISIGAIVQVSRLGTSINRRLRLMKYTTNKTAMPNSKNIQRKYSTRAALCQVSANRAAPVTSTETSRDTPGSYIVTPIKCRESSIVALLWVIKINCTLSDISRTSSQ